jgi:hypothetical protein
MHLYLLLYTGGSMPATGEATRAMTESWGSWLAALGDALADGNPFTPEARTSRPTGWSRTVPWARWHLATP